MHPQIEIGSRDRRQNRREMRRSQRQDRRAKNKELKEQGYSFIERRRIIRNMRRRDFQRRRVADARTRMQELDRKVQTPKEERLQARGRDGAASSAPLPPPPMAPPRVPGRVLDQPLLRPGPRVMPPPRAMPPLLPPPVRHQAAAPPWEAELDPSYSPAPAMPAWGPQYVDYVDPYETQVYEDANGGQTFVAPDGTVYYDADGDSFELEADEWAGEVFDLAGELAGELQRQPTVAGAVIGADEFEDVVEALGRAYLASLRAVAEADGWEPQELAEDEKIIMDATNLVSGTIGLAIEGEVGAAGAALAAIPALAALSAPILNARRNAQDRQDGRRDRRQDRIEERLKELKQYGPRAGILADGEWGPSTDTENIRIRAKVGRRAAVVNVGHGFYLLHDVDERTPVDEIQAKMSTAANATIAALGVVVPPAPLAGLIGGCSGGCTCKKRLGW
jgi:hypothetical protein